MHRKSAQMAELVDALVSNTSGFTSMPVRSRLWVQITAVNLLIFSRFYFLGYKQGINKRQHPHFWGCPCGNLGVVEVAGSNGKCDNKKRRAKHHALPVEKQRKYNFSTKLWKNRQCHTTQRQKIALAVSNVTNVTLGVEVAGIAVPIHMQMCFRIRG